MSTFIEKEGNQNIYNIIIKYLIPQHRMFSNTVQCDESYSERIQSLNLKVHIASCWKNCVFYIIWIISQQTTYYNISNLISYKISIQVEYGGVLLTGIQLFDLKLQSSKLIYTKWYAHVTPTFIRFLWIAEILTYYIENDRA